MDREKLELIYNGVTRIQEGMYIGIGLGLMYGVTSLVLNFLGLTSVGLMIRGYGILQIAEVAIGVPVLYYYMYRGFNELVRADRARYGIGMLGIKVLLLISPLLLAEGLYLALVNQSPVTFLLLRVVNSIIALVLYVLVLIALYRLGSEFDADRLKVGVVMTIVTVFILMLPNVIAAIIGIVGVMLMLMGLGDVKRAIERELGIGSQGSP
ncbi:DUF973 family protein [Vulcanisaeta distributa]|nr:DUF973 family protein [Vulcanisaeta distributa]